MLSYKVRFFMLLDRSNDLYIAQETIPRECFSQVDRYIRESSEQPECFNSRRVFFLLASSRQGAVLGVASMASSELLTGSS